MIERDKRAKGRRERERERRQNVHAHGCSCARMHDTVGAYKSLMDESPACPHVGVHVPLHALVSPQCHLAEGSAAWHRAVLGFTSGGWSSWHCGL